MKRTMPKTPVVTLDCLPDFLPVESKGKRSENMAIFLRGVILERLSGKTSTIHLPSFNQLAYFFKCSHMELYDAFRFLRAQGCDFTLTGLELPVLIRRDG
jgi:hypothetical protein